MQAQRHRWIRSLATAGLVLGFTGLARAETHTWNDADGSDWFEATNWTPSGPPSADADGVYTNAGTALLLTNETPCCAPMAAKEGYGTPPITAAAAAAADASPCGRECPRPCGNA